MARSVRASIAPHRSIGVGETFRRVVNPSERRVGEWSVETSLCAYRTRASKDGSVPPWKHARDRRRRLPEVGSPTGPTRVTAWESQPARVPCRCPSRCPSDNRKRPKRRRSDNGRIPLIYLGLPADSPVVPGSSFRLHTAEVTGSIPVAPTVRLPCVHRDSPFLESSNGLRFVSGVRHESQPGWPRTFRGAHGQPAASTAKSWARTVQGALVGSPGESSALSQVVPLC